MMAELDANREARKRQESHTAELEEAVTCLVGQVRGQGSNPTPEPSGEAGGGGGGRPPPAVHGATGGTPDPGDSDRD